MTCHLSVKYYLTVLCQDHMDVDPSEEEADDDDDDDASMDDGMIGRSILS